MLTENPTPIINPLLEEFRANPYPFFEMQRERSGIHWNPIFQGWVVIDHDLISQILKDDRFSSDRTDSLFSRLDDGTISEMSPLKKIMKEWSIMVDPPYHTSLRSVMNEAFAPKIVRGFEVRIEAIVEELLEPLTQANDFDFVAKLAYPLPATVIADILGLPRSKTAWFEGLSKDIIGVFNLSTRPLPEIAHAAQNAILELNAYFNEILDTPSEHSAGSMIQVLGQLENEHQQLTRSEVLSMISLLLIAGHETTRNLLANGLLCIMDRPETYQNLKDNPDLLPSAIEEMLRFESPAQLTSRFPTEDLAVGGMDIPTGQRLMLYLGAANRDPKTFDRSDEFDISRSPNKHVAFGFGRHFCVGSMLARLEAKVAFNYILNNFPILKHEGDLKWGTDVAFRCLTELKVSRR